MSEDSRRAARRQAVFMLYQHDVTGLSPEEIEENAERERGREIDAYTRRMIEGITRRRESIDAAIDRAARGWSVERIAPLERSILRVAVNELIAEETIPTAVAIDEAVEMAKRYCQADAAAFVNGILGTIAHDVRSQTA
jgi:N utilization substance protein B